MTESSCALTWIFEIGRLSSYLISLSIVQFNLDHSFWKEEKKIYTSEVILLEAIEIGEVLLFGVQQFWLMRQRVEKYVTAYTRTYR